MNNLEQLDSNVTIYLEGIHGEVELGLKTLDSETGEMPVISKKEYLESFNKDESRLALKQFVDEFEPTDIDIDTLCNMEE